MRLMIITSWNLSISGQWGIWAGEWGKTSAPQKSLTCNPLITLITREALLGRYNDFVRLLPVCSNSQRLRLFENHGICSTRWEVSAGRRWPAWLSAPPATSSRPWKVNTLFHHILTFFLVSVCVLVFVFVLTMIERHYKLPLDHVDSRCCGSWAFQVALFWKILKDGRWPAVVFVIHSSIRLTLCVVETSNRYSP